MMRSTVTLAGNLGGDPELRFTASGTAVCTFNVAVGSRQKDAAGTWQDGPTSWYQAVAFKELAEDCAEKLFKGSKVLLFGTLSIEDWQTKDGTSRRTAKIAVDEVGLSVRQSKAQRESSSAVDEWASAESPPF